MNTDIDQKPYNPSVTFYNGTELVAGAEFLYQSGDTQVLIDCGLIQGTPDQQLLNYEPFQYDPKSIDVLIISHAHMDHVGRVPKLVRAGFRGKIISSEPTRDIGYHMLYDELSLMSHEAAKGGREPMFDQDDIELSMKLWQGFDYGEQVSLAENLSVTLYDAGHILGSSMMLIDDAGTRTLFTGDLGNSPSPLLRDTDDTPRPHYLVTESVYGDRNHETKINRTERLEQVYRDNIARKGVLLIPAFSVERTQEILLEFDHLIESGKLPKVPVFVDSPLGIKVTEIFQKYPQYMKNEIQHEMLTDNVFTFPGLTFTPNAEQSKKIPDEPNPKVIIASSGMSAGGRIIFHEQRYLPDPNNTLLFVGYQAAGTLGRKILEGMKKVYIMGVEVPVRARIETITGYSGHKDQEHLLKFVGEISTNIHKVFCVLGEAGSSASLAQNIRDMHGLDAIVPERATAYELPRI
jgi:metallo-beta-lactamase family protein